MRLTLRTLLAYLDDTLEPAQAKLIGQKVAESEVAQELIERIKQVTRRRKLGAPPVSGAGSKLDPNTVSEYLDSVLPSEKLGETEESILKDDVLLAEVAACHQILALYLGQPAEVPPTAHKRMADLIKGHAPAPARKAPAPAPRRVAAALPDTPARSDDETDEALLLGLGSVRDRGAWVRRLAPVAAVLLLVGLLGVALSQLIPSGPPARNSDHLQARGDSEKAPTEPRQTVPQPTKLETSPEKLPPDKTPPEKLPPEKDPPDKTPIDTVPVDKPNPLRKEIGKYVPTSFPTTSVLLQKPTGKDTWQRVRPEAPVSTTDSLLSLPGYRSELNLTGGVQLMLWGNLPEFSPLPALESGVVLHSPATGMDADITLERGRIVVANQKADGEARIRVRFLDEIWDLTLKGSKSVVSLELFGRYSNEVPFSRDGKGEGPTASVFLVGLDGDVEVKIGYQSFSLPAPSLYVWDNAGVRARGVQPLKPDAVRWFTNREPSEAPSFKEPVAALKELAKRLDGKSVQVALAETRKEAKGYLLILCVFCLGAIDDLNDLVDCLADDRGEVRYRAIEDLRHWIGLRADHDAKLFKALQKPYSVLQAETIMTLLHGIPAEEWTRSDIYDTLIEYLKHDKIGIRELAYYHLLRRVPDAQKINYRPDMPAAQREAGYEQWKKLLTSGKLLPKGGK